jgi:hypothetical protein
MANFLVNPEISNLLCLSVRDCITMFFIVERICNRFYWSRECAEFQIAATLSQLDYHDREKDSFYIRNKELQVRSSE